MRLEFRTQVFRLFVVIYYLIEIFVLLLLKYLVNMIRFFRLCSKYEIFVHVRDELAIVMI